MCDATVGGVSCQLSAGHDGSHMTVSGVPFGEGEADA